MNYLAYLVDNLKEKIVYGKTVASSSTGVGGTYLNLNKEIISIVGVHIGGADNTNVIIDSAKSNLTDGRVLFRTTASVTASILYIAILK